MSHSLPLIEYFPLFTILQEMFDLLHLAVEVVAWKGRISWISNGPVVLVVDSVLVDNSSPESVVTIFTCLDQISSLTILPAWSCNLPDRLDWRVPAGKWKVVKNHLRNRDLWYSACIAATEQHLLRHVGTGFSILECTLWQKEILAVTTGEANVGFLVVVDVLNTRSQIRTIVLCLLSFSRDDGLKLWTQSLLEPITGLVVIGWGHMIATSTKSKVCVPAEFGQSTVKRKEINSVQGLIARRAQEDVVHLTTTIIATGKIAMGIWKLVMQARFEILWFDGSTFIGLLGLRFL